MFLDEEDLINMVIGLSFFGCGGGGSRKEGLEMIRGIGGIDLVDLDELDDEMMIASPYACGSLESDLPDEEGVFKELKAVLELQNFLKVEFAGLFATELGAYNTAVIFRISKELGIPIIDGDGAGRAVPEIQHSIPSFLGYRAIPASVVLSNGDTLIFKDVESDEKFEKIVRHLVSKFGNVGVCDHPMKVKDAKMSLVRGSLTTSLKVGESLKRGDLDSILSLTNGKILKEGKIEKVERIQSEGFTEGRVWIDGDVMYFKNENMVFECGGRRYEFPDLLVLMSTKDLIPLENPPREGECVYVFTVRADERWYTYGRKMEW